MAGRLFARIAHSALSLTNTLTQYQTNGASVFGTLGAPTMQPYLGNKSSWGSRTVAGSDMIQDMPTTGMLWG